MLIFSSAKLKWPNQTKGELPEVGRNSPCVIGAAFHLQQAGLVQRTGVDVNDMAIGGGTRRQSLVVLREKPRLSLASAHWHSKDAAPKALSGATITFVH